jgi:hypothetical protein
MKHVKFVSPKLSLLLVPILLCVSAGSVGATEDLTWPIRAELKVKDWVVDTPHAWMAVGDVAIFNTKGDLKADIYPYTDYKIKNVSIHVVQDPIVFEDVLDRDGKPRTSRFDHKTDYLGDQGILVDHHREVIPLSDFEICWGANPERCPLDLYFVVHVELQQAELVEVEEGVFEEIWVDLPEQAYAEGGGTFDRLDRDDGSIWGWYLGYPLAKVEPGHFIDANVNGLAYSTATQSGTTGEEGQFWYLPGEDVGFALGGLYLGDAVGDRGVSPLDLFEGADMDDDRALNVARLLQSFDADGNPAQGAINITEPVVACLDSALVGVPAMTPEEFFGNDDLVGQVIDDTIAACADEIALTAVSKEEARENLDSGMKAGNLMKRNVSKTPGMKSDKAKVEIVPVYVPAQRSDGSRTDVIYHDADGNVIETRSEAKPIVISYLDEVEGSGAADVYVAISRDDGDSWKRRNVSKTADKSSLVGYPGVSQKPMLKVKDNKIFVAWTDKYCRGGRPGYAITVCPDTTGDGLPDPCEVCRQTDEGERCTLDYPGDDAYWQDDLFGVGGPQRSVVYEDFPEMSEVAYSCVWTVRAVIEPDGTIQWFKPERLTSGRRDAFQLFAGAATDVGFAIVWQEDPKGLRPGEGDGPGDGWSGARSSNKTDIWYSYITLADFGQVDHDYPAGGPGHDDDFVDWDPDLAGRVKALVPMSLPVKVSDNDVCSLENMDPAGGSGEHDYDGEGEGTHRYCGTLEGIGTADSPGSNALCSYTVERANPKGEIHHVCVTADGRLLDGNTGASRANVFLQPYRKSDGTKSAWAIVGYEESKGVGIPPDHDSGCEDEGEEGEDEHETKYKPDEGKNVIYHSFDFRAPEPVDGGGILNLPETDASGDPVYLVDEFGALLLDWKGDPQLAYENARRVRFISQPKSKKGASGTVLVALYRQGEEGKGKPADVFMRRVVASPSGNPYAFGNFVDGARNLSSVEVTEEFQNPFDPEAPVKMLRWAWSPDNLADSSAKNPHTDARAQRGAINGDDLLIGYSWTPNWGRRANDKYDFYVRRSFDGGGSWTPDPDDVEPIEHNVVFRVPVIDYESETVSWDEEIVSATYFGSDPEPPRNVSNLRNNRTSVLEPRLVKAPGTIKDLFGNPTGYPEDVQDSSVFQLAYGLEFNQNQLPDGVELPQIPLDIYYSRTKDKGQRYESVVVTPQGGSGKPGEGWNLLAKDKPEQGAAQLRQTPDGSRMYAIWLEESEQGSDIMFRRVDYR